MAVSNFQPGRAIAPVSQVEISVSCRNLRDRDAMSKSDPMAVIFMKEFGNPRFVEFGRTEKIKNTLSPDFARKFLVDYHFEEVQVLRVEIYDIDADTTALNAHDFLGRIECSLGEIVGAQGGKIHRNLQDNHGHTVGSIILSAEEVGANKDVAQMQWKGVKLDKKDFLGKSDPFIQIFRVEADGSTKLAYRSEIISNSLNPIWKPFRVPVRQLCGDNIDRTIRFECYDWDNDGAESHDLIGTFETTFRRLSQGANNPQNIYDLINPKKQAKKKDYKNSGQLHLAQFSVETEYSFLDFIRGGTQLHFSVAVDFTASNGEPHDPKSLHYIHPQYPNQYMIALKSVGEIIQDYDHDKMFPALGFGAKLPPHGTLSHEFFLNFSNDPHCYGVNGILDAYRGAVTSVQLYGPTNFSPVINHVARFAAAARDGTHYFILLIITDGAITDLDDTVASIIDSSALPMSIIIVGVGDADFSAMKFLDADNGRLQQGTRYAQRDMVQFVAMRSYVNGSSHELSQARLAKDVLAEVPQQVTAFMRMIGMKPRPPVHVDVPQPSAGSVSPPGPPGEAPYGQQPPPPTGSQGLPPYSQQGQQPAGHGVPFGQQPPPTGAPASSPYGHGQQQPPPTGAYGQVPYGQQPPAPSGYPQQGYPLHQFAPSQQASGYPQAFGNPPPYQAVGPHQGYAQQQAQYAQQQPPAYPGNASFQQPQYGSPQGHNQAQAPPSYQPYGAGGHGYPPPPAAP